MYTVIICQISESTLLLPYITETFDVWLSGIRIELSQTELPTTLLNMVEAS